MKTEKHGFFIVIFMCHVCFFFRGYTQPKVKFEHYSTEQGLSHDIIPAMLKDAKGYIWLGTWDGINRFDGQNFTSFSATQKVFNNTRIDQIVEGAHHNLWVKSYDGQVFRFDRGTENFTPFSQYFQGVNKTSIQRILAVANGQVWLKPYTGGLIMLADDKSKQPKMVRFSKMAAKPFKLPSDTINFFFSVDKTTIVLGTTNGVIGIKTGAGGTAKTQSLNLAESGKENFTAVAKSGNQLLLGTKNGKLIQYHLGKAAFTSVRVSKGKINAILPARNGRTIYLSTSLGELLVLDVASGKINMNTYQDGALFSLFEDHHQQIWIEPEKKGIVRFDVYSGSFTNFVQRNDADRIAPLNHFKVFEDRKKVVWAILRDGGFGYYDAAAQKFKYFYNEPGGADRKISNLVISALYDSSGVMFLHTDRRGLDKVVFHPNEFKTELVNPAALFKSDNEVRGLFSDNRNRLWVSARSGGLYIYENNKRLNVSFLNLPADGIGAVYSISQTKDGAIWITTKDKGLYFAVPTDETALSYKLTHFLHDPKNDASIGSNQIYSVKENDKGDIWIGTFDHGLNLLERHSGKFVFKKITSEAHGYPKGFQKIRHLAIDKRGRLWAGTTAGLVILETKPDGRLVCNSFNKILGDSGSLANNDVQYIYQDHLDRMWLGTSGGGLNLALPQKNNSLKFKVYSSANGLDNNYILSMVEDRNKKLWVATKRSLVRFDLQKNRFDSFNSYDGIPTDGFSESSVTQSQSGNLIFGTIRGFLSFNPQQIIPDPIDANMVFTRLQVNNKDVLVGAEDQILDRNIDHTEKIYLAHDQNVISIDYTVLDYRSSERQHYLYKLTGFDENWQNNKNEHRASYTNLPPGKYVFQVKSVDHDLYKTPPTKSIEIIINPPFWKIWWAYLFYFLVALAGLLAARRIIIAFLKLRQQIAVEHQMADLKMRFFTNISHELRTPLTLIINPIDEIIKSPADAEQVSTYAAIVRKNANRMVIFVNQLLDLRKTQSAQNTLRFSRLNIFDHLETVITYFEEEAKAKGLNIKLLGERFLWVNVDADKIETVVYNVLGNALKFSSQGQEITINVRQKTDTGFLITVNDQGTGIPPEDLETIFQLFHESRNAQTQHIKGTGIGLALAKELVELHGGKIWASNLSPSGLSVSITIPINATAEVEPEKLEISAEIEATEPVDLSNPSKKFSLPEHAEGKSKQRILLVEDNAEMSQFLKGLLERHYLVLTAKNGVEGISMAKKKQPDLILSDIMMPKMNGIEMLEVLKNEISTSHIPIILLSAKSAIESQIDGLKYGADHYISKPFNSAFLFAAIQNVLQQRKRITAYLLAENKVVNLTPGQVVVTSKDEQFLQKVVAIVREKMVDSEFEIDTVASMMNMARTTFFMKFKSLTQQAPVEFIRDMRLQLAKQLLDGGAGNISEISYAVGFGNAKYFSTCFKAAYGLTPSEYARARNSAS